VIEYIQEEQDDECKGVDIYSSKTAAWIFKESKWGPNTCVAIERLEEDMRSSETMYLNGCLHIMEDCGFRSLILAMDMEGETWRKIHCPCGSDGSIHQAQGHLCVCTVHDRNLSKLLIWILKDYGTNKWTLKHTVSILEVFAQTNIEFSYYSCYDNENYSTVHLEWNLLLFVWVGVENDIVAYNMDNRKVYVIPTRYRQFLKCDILPEIKGTPYYLPYVPLFSKFESLA
jgi:hypothetical protein